MTTCSRVHQITHQQGGEGPCSQEACGAGASEYRQFDSIWQGAKDQAPDHRPYCEQVRVKTLEVVRSNHFPKSLFWEVMGREAAAAVKDVWPG